MNTGIALIGKGAGRYAAAGVLQSFQTLAIPPGPLLAVGDTALPVLTWLLCKKYGLPRTRWIRMNHETLISQLELWRMRCWLRKHSSAAPLSGQPLLFFFQAPNPLVICAPKTDVFLKEGKLLCENDAQLLAAVVEASRRQKPARRFETWPLRAAGAEKSVTVLLNVPPDSLAEGDRLLFETGAPSPEQAADDVFRQAWSRREEIYDKLLF